MSEEKLNGDRALLELAAKAAGIELGYWVSNPSIEHFVIADDGPEWNPLADDGDALRLAVKLGMFMRSIVREVSHEEYAADPYATIRRAIVMEAAEIGRGMP